jgi:hypothetical protein
MWRNFYCFVQKKKLGRKRKGQNAGRREEMSMLEGNLYKLKKKILNREINNELKKYFFTDISEDFC